MDLLAEHHRVVTYDLRGIGSSSAQGPYDMETDAEDLAALIEETCDGAGRDRRAWATARTARCTLARRPARAGAGRRVRRRQPGQPHGRRGRGGPRRLRLGDRGAAGDDGDRLPRRAAHDDLDRESRPRRGRGARPRERERRALPAGGGRAAHAIVGRGRGARAARARSATASGSSRTAPTRGSWRRRKRTAELLPEAHVHEVENGAVSRPDIAASYISAITGVGDRR